MPQNQHEKQDETEMTNKMAERRHIKPSHDTLFRVIAMLNIAAWVSLIIALVLFHYARPDFISGVQKYWGVEGREHWAGGHLSNLLIMLQVCLVLSLIGIVMRIKRNRRKTDSFGVNLIILIAISGISIITIYTDSF